MPRDRTSAGLKMPEEAAREFIKGAFHCGTIERTMQKRRRKFQEVCEQSHLALHSRLRDRSFLRTSRRPQHAVRGVWNILRFYPKKGSRKDEATSTYGCISSCAGVEIFSNGATEGNSELYVCEMKRDTSRFHSAVRVPLVTKLKIAANKAIKAR